MKHINYFESAAEQTAAYETEEFKLPQVDYCLETNIVSYHPIDTFFKTSGNIGDFYYENGKFSTDVDLTKGTPIGIVTIPKDFIASSPNGRIMSLLWMSNSGFTGTTQECLLNYGLIGVSTVRCYKKLACCGTKYSGSSTVSSVQDTANLPSDSFSGEIQYSGDPTTYYLGSAASEQYNAISPFLTDENGNTIFNTEYIKTDSPSSVQNGFSNLDGYGDTAILTNDKNTSGQTDWKTADTIVNESSWESAFGYSPAACCCKRFNVGNLDWYFPSIGELGFIMPRMKVLNDQMQKLIDNGGEQFCSLLNGGTILSSTDIYTNSRRGINTSNGSAFLCATEDTNYQVRAFAMF